MENDRKIGYHETLALITTMLTAKVFLSFPRDMVVNGDSAGWILVLCSGILSIVGFYFLYQLLNNHPSQTIFQISRQLTGNWIGTFLGILVFLLFLALTSMYLRQFAESFILAILPHTPISVITGIFLLLLIYSNLLGIETITRVAWFLWPYIGGALIIIILSILPVTSFGFLTPILGKGPLPILKSSLFQTSAFSEILILGILAPLLRQKEKLLQLGLKGLSLAMIINGGCTALVVMVFNYVAAQRQIFPVLQLTRLISFGEFFQRVEAVFVFLWFFWAGIQLGGLFYATVVSYAKTFKISEYRPLLFPIAILVFTLSLIPSSMTAAVQFNDFFLSQFYPLIVFGLPFILWLIFCIRNKFSGDNHA